MMMPTIQNLITGPQAKALVALIHELRPDWDERGILPALHAARERAGNLDLAVAAIRAAGNASNRTPAVIAMEGPHWHAPETMARRPSLRMMCMKCRWYHLPDEPCDPPPPDEHRDSLERKALRDAARAAIRGDA